MLQNETNKSFQIEHAKKIAQAISLLLINILGLQLVSQREQLGKSERETKSFEHLEIYTCSKPMTTQQIFESNEQICLEYNILIPNIYIPEETKKTVLNFSEIIRHSLPKISPNPSFENYYVVMEKLSQINIGQLKPQQQNQLKELIAEFADIFAENNNDLGRTDLVQHQIYTGDAKPRQQQTY
ncbi:hypothetical protein G9A89_015365 [Geosiphon pyriformis]|nr:hypothetical protein G9A89_015365 [Geosiphon pyriformis]